MANFKILLLEDGDCAIQKEGRSQVPLFLKSDVLGVEDWEEIATYYDKFITTSIHSLDVVGVLAEFSFDEVKGIEVKTNA